MEGLLSKMRTILAAVDQSHHAHDVMSRAAELAVLLRNDLVVLSVISSDPMKQFNIVEEQNRFASFHRELIFKHFPENSLAVEPHNGTGGVYKHGTAGVRIQSRILSGNVVDKICACAEEVNADLVLVGSRGLGNIVSVVPAVPLRASSAISSEAMTTLLLEDPDRKLTALSILGPILPSGN